MNKNGPAEEHETRQETALVLRQLGKAARHAGIPRHRMSTVLFDVHPETFRRIMEAAADLVQDYVEYIEVEEHHTFAKPDDVSDIDFPSVSSEDK